MARRWDRGAGGKDAILGLFGQLALETCVRGGGEQGRAGAALEAWPSQDSALTARGFDFLLSCAEPEWQVA